MTPRELDLGAVHAKLRVVRELLGDLEDLGDPTATRLRDERLTRHAAERILTQLVDVAVSVNSHIAAARLGRAAATYRGSFALAAEAGAISQDVAAALAPSAGLRNVLTHEYVDVDLAIVAASISPAREGFARWLDEVSRFLVR